MTDKIRKHDWYDKAVQTLIPSSINVEDRPYAHFVLRWLREGVKVARKYGETMAPTAYGNLKKNGFVRGNKLACDPEGVGFLLLILGARGYVRQISRKGAKNHELHGLRLAM